MTDNSTKQKLFTPSYLISFFLSTQVFLVNFIIITIIPLQLSEKMGASRVEIGTVLGLSGIGILILRPLIGFAMDVWDKRIFLSASLFFLSLSSFSFLLAKTPAAILLFRILQTLSYAAASTALTTIAIDIIPSERRGEGLSYFTSASTLALAIGPAVGIALYQNNWYGTPFIVSGILALICLYFSLFVKVPERNRSKPKFSVRSIFDRRIMIVSIIVALGYMGFVGLISFGTLYTLEINIPQNRISLASTLFSIGLVTSRLLTAKTMDGKGPGFSGILSMILTTVGLGVIGILPSVVGLLLGSFILGGGIGIVLPTGLAMAMDLAHPSKKGLSTCLIYSGVDIGHSIGSVLFGFFGDIFNSYGKAFLMFSGIEFMGLIVFKYLILPFFIREKKRVMKLIDNGYRTTNHI